MQSIRFSDPRGVPAHNTRKHDAPLVDMALLSLCEKTVVVAPLFLPRVGMCAAPRENESFDSGSAHSFDSGKNNGVLTLDVSCNCPSHGIESHMILNTK